MGQQGNIIMRKLICKVCMYILISTLLYGCGLELKLGRKIDTSQTFVPEEGGITFVKVTNEENDQLIVPNISNRNGHLSWWANPYFAFSADGEKFAYVGSHNGRNNIFIKSLSFRSGSQQRTFSDNAEGMAFSPDGKSLCFSQQNNGYSTLFLTNSSQGSIVQQVTSGSVRDYSPQYSTDGSMIFFARAEGNHFSIWSYKISNGTLSNYCYGLTPYPINKEEFLCSRQNSKNNYEIWRINYVKGTENIILSQENRSFTTASLSPDGKWILFTSNTPGTENAPENLDIYVIRADGSQMTQLT